MPKTKLPAKSKPAPVKTKKPAAPIFQRFQQMYISEIPDADLSQINSKSLHHLINRQYEQAETRGQEKIPDRNRKSGY